MFLHFPINKIGISLIAAFFMIIEPVDACAEDYWSEWKNITASESKLHVNEIHLFSTPIRQYRTMRGVDTRQEQWKWRSGGLFLERVGHGLVYMIDMSTTKMAVKSINGWGDKVGATEDLIRRGENSIGIYFYYLHQNRNNCIYVYQAVPSVSSDRPGENNVAIISAVGCARKGSGSLEKVEKNFIKFVGTWKFMGAD